MGSMLLLGAAYGVLKEGLMVTSFFSPNWPDLGAMAAYGRWLDVNWVWAEMLTIYHAVFSISIPILLVELAYPQRKSENWIGKKLFIALLAVLFTLTVFGFFLFSSFMNYWTPAPQYLFGIALMVLSIYLARTLPTTLRQQRQKITPKSIVLWLFFHRGRICLLPRFLGTALCRYSLGDCMLYGPLLILLVASFVKRFNWHQEPNGTHLFALVSGALTFFIIFAPLQELDKNRSDVTTGMSLVAQAFTIGLIWLGLKIKRRNPTLKTMPTLPNKPS